MPPHSTRNEALMVKHPKTSLRRALVTGASSGIGLSAARLFAAQGYAVVGTCRHPETLKEKPAGVTYVAADLADPNAVERLHREAESILGGIDVLVNNAGMGELGAVEDTEMDFARRMFEINYFAAVRLTQLVLPGMRARQSGAILNLGSIVHSLQFPFKAQYCASKSALSGFTLSLRHEVSPHGIRVHLFEPGWVRSDFHNRLVPSTQSGSPYANRLKPFLDYSRDSDPRIPDGEAVARVLLSTLENRKAPVRIAVGAEAKKFFFVSRFLTHNLVDRILHYKLVKKSGAF
jgi:short-subunit dehydrogenase